VKLKYSIGIATKMIFMVTLVILGAIAAVVHISTDLFREDSIARIQVMNKETAENLADRVLASFQDSSQKMTLMAQFALNSPTMDEAQRAIGNVLSGNDDLISFSAFLIDEKGQPQHQLTVVDNAAMAEFGLKPDDISEKIQKRIWQEQSGRVEEIVIVNSSPEYGVPLFSLSFLSKKEVAASTELQNEKKEQENKTEAKEEKASPLAGRWLFRSEQRQDSVLRMFAKKKRLNAYLIDGQGRLMAHSNPERMHEVISAKSLAQHVIVDHMLRENLDNRLMEYKSADQMEMLGAYNKVGVANIGVIAEVDKSRELATIKRVQDRSFLVMIIVVCFAFILNFGFSKSITAPLKKLFAATEKIVEGDYDVELTVKSHDEVGALAQGFMDMASGLKERKKLQGAFDKLHSKELAKKLLSGEIKLGGERKHVTVFFSDIRNFTATSESMSPDQVVSMLNEYMTEMVEIVNKWHGVVDKFVGDAIMAVWGMVDVGPDDANNAVRAALEMRERLIGFNESRRQRNLNEINIGMGIHTGEVVTGYIGSEQKMEFTAIGDTVNMAARLEAANKPLKADILISGTTYSLVKSHGIKVGPELRIHAKGKTDAIVVHQVIGHSENGQLKTSLTNERLSFIRNQDPDIEDVGEEKIQTGSGNKPEENDKTQVIASDASVGVSPIKPQTPAIAEWYIITNPTTGEAVGPYTAEIIRLQLAQKQLQYESTYVYKQGDPQALPVSQVAEFARRDSQAAPITAPMPETVIREAALPSEWYVHGPEGQTLGPYNVPELQAALDSGHLTRTTYVWKQGLENWIYLHQIPEFDRRGESENQAPIPLGGEQKTG
jgi:adenylate cyclase